MRKRHLPAVVTLIRADPSKVPALVQQPISGNMGGTTTVREQAPNHMQPAFTTRS
jgi:hypothetical protein